ncbi:unnamed protein product, partial [Amoebophrya sp. A25]
AEEFQVSSYTFGCWDHVDVIPQQDPYVILLVFFIHLAQALSILSPI